MDTRVKELLEKNGYSKDNLMPILQGLQDIYGYLSFDNLKLVSEEIDYSLEKIYGVVTFYSQFRLNPKAKHTISVCLGTVCYVNGSNEILEEVKRELNITENQTTSDNMFAIENTRCLGCCSLAPVMMIDDKVYSQVKQEDVKNILDEYRRKDV